MLKKTVYQFWNNCRSTTELIFGQWRLEIIVNSQNSENLKNFDFSSFWAMFSNRESHKTIGIPLIFHYFPDSLWEIVSKKHEKIKNFYFSWILAINNYFKYLLSKKQPRSASGTVSKLVNTFLTFKHILTISIAILGRISSSFDDFSIFFQL